jgi:hypothetical protein
MWLNLKYGNGSAYWPACFLRRERPRQTTLLANNRDWRRTTPSRPRSSQGPNALGRRFINNTHQVAFIREATVANIVNLFHHIGKYITEEATKKLI